MPLMALLGKYESVLPRYPLRVSGVLDFVSPRPSFHLVLVAKSAKDGDRVEVDADHGVVRKF